MGSPPSERDPTENSAISIIGLRLLPRRSLWGGCVRADGVPSVANRDDKPHTYIRLAALPHFEVELHTRAAPRAFKRICRRAAQAALIKTEVGLALHILDDAIDGKHGHVETVFGGLDLAFDG
jgi:hypothetical protein